VRRPLLLALPIFAVLLAVVACSGDDNTGPGTGGDDSGTDSSASDTGIDATGDGNASDGPSDGGEGLDGDGAADGPLAEASVDAAPDVDAGCAAALYVNVTTGSDIHAGDIGSPVRTLTHAIARAGGSACATTIHVAPGTYNAASGETFPLTPSNVTIVGDETNKGNAAAGATLITGGGLHMVLTNHYYPTLLLGPNVTLAGLKITSPHVALDGSSYLGIGVIIQAAGTEVRDNTITACDYFGVDVEGAGSGTIENNAITGNGGGGPFSGGGVQVDNGSMKLQNNVITGNTGFGVILGSTCDLGGGTLMSAGGNTFSCNTRSDVYGTNIQAQNCFWDHVPPTIGTTGGADVGSSVTTTGAMLATSPCP
jgi:parallel beta-helix repeat protein